MTERDRLFERAFRRPNRPAPACVAILALSVVLAIAGTTVALRPVPITTPPTASAPSASDDFWEILFASDGTGPAYSSLAELGRTSEAIILGGFTGEVEQGREVCDDQALLNDLPRAQACVFFANLPFVIDEVLAGNLREVPPQSVTSPPRTVTVEYMMPPHQQASLRLASPPGDWVVLFVASKALRLSGIEDVYYNVGLGQGAFRLTVDVAANPDVAERVVPLGLTDDPQYGRLEGLSFERLFEIVRGVPVLDLLPDGFIPSPRPTPGLP